MHRLAYRRSAAALLLVLATSSACAQGLGLDDDDERREPPPSLPQGSTGVIRPGDNAPPRARIERLGQVFQAIQACWKLPAGSGYSGQELTIRMSFRRDGTVIGQPKITYYNGGTQTERREAFMQSVRDAFVNCTPLPFSESFGAANAGRPFIFRFIDAQPL